MLSFSMAQQVVAEMKTSGADVACECWWLLDVVVSVSAGKNSCGLEGRLSLWLLHWSRPLPCQAVVIFRTVTCQLA